MLYSAFLESLLLVNLILHFIACWGQFLELNVISPSSLSAVKFHGVSSTSFGNIDSAIGHSSSSALLLSSTSRRRNPRSALTVREKQIDRPLVLGTSSQRMERSFPAKVTSFRAANNTWSPVRRIVRIVRNAKRVVLSRLTR